MGATTIPTRLATADDAVVLANLLHDFNVEFDTPSPGVEFLVTRLRQLLPGDGTFAVLAGDPVLGFGLVTLRTNVWFEGRVALLDELYVRPDRRDQGIGSVLIDRLEAECRARDVDYVEINVDESDVDTQRFYDRHGYAGVDPDTGERAYYFSKELGPSSAFAIGSNLSRLEP